MNREIDLPNVGTEGHPDHAEKPYCIFDISMTAIRMIKASDGITAFDLIKKLKKEYPDASSDDIWEAIDNLG